MHESKRERYIRIIKDKLEDDFMAICHELHFTEEAVKELLWLLEDKKIKKPNGSGQAKSTREH